MPTTDITSLVGTRGSHTLSFQNPFKHPLPVDVVLTSSCKDDEDNKAFELLLRKSTGIVVACQSAMQIGVSFTPLSLKAYSAGKILYS